MHIAIGAVFAGIVNAAGKFFCLKFFRQKKIKIFEHFESSFKKLK